MTPPVYPPPPPNHSHPPTPRQQQQGQSFSNPIDPDWYLKKEMLEARIAAAEKEIDALHATLTQERRAAVSLQNQLQQQKQQQQHQKLHQQELQQEAVEGTAPTPGVVEDSPENNQQRAGNNGNNPSGQSQIGSIQSILASTETFLREAMIDIEFPEGQGEQFDTQFY